MRLKRSQRVLSGLLSLILSVSLFLSGMPVTAVAAEESRPAGQPTGSIALTVYFDLPQTKAGVDGRNITLRLSGGEKEIEVPLSAGAASVNSLGAQVSVEVKNAAGETWVNEERIGAYQAVLSGLPAQGVEYILTLTGQGYGTFQKTLTLKDYSKHVLVHTLDGGFPLGDVDNRGTSAGKVDGADLAAMTAQLGQTGNLPLYDLNGDGKVDVTDLSYVNLVRGVADTSEIQDTAAIVSAGVETAGLNVEGEIADLFTGGEAVKLSGKDGGALEIPVVLDSEKGVEMSCIDLTSPTVDGAVQAGIARLELADGSSLEVPFGGPAPAGVHAVGPVEGQNTVRIDLGKRVAVKKVTITVTAVAGQTDGRPAYAVVTQIEFLKDIGQDNAQNDAGQVKGLIAEAGDGKVDLVWNPVRNVTGYTVRYGEGPNALDKTMTVNRNRAAVSGLENLKPCYFQVTAVNGAWTGAPSAVVSATPEPAKAPGAPSNIRVIAANQSLRLSWGKTKDATYYQVFYRKEGEREYTRFGGDITATSAIVTGLINGTSYEVAVRAGNRAGVGPYSAVALGTPKSEKIEMPELPADGRIENSRITSIVMANAGNVNTSLCPGFSTAQLIDNNPNTYWVAKDWWLNSQITYTFAEPQDMNYLILVPYLGDGHKYALEKYHITALNEDGNKLIDDQVVYTHGLTAKDYLVLPFDAVKGVKSLAVSLDERSGNGYRVSAAEVAFYKSDSLPEDIAELFTDGTFTQLKSGVTEERIAALEARLSEKSDFYLELDRLKDELSLARKLYEKDESALGLVKDDFQSRAGSLDKTGQTASNLQPLGISARAGATVAIYAELPAGEAVSVTPTQFFGESGIWCGSAISLVNGRNYITVPQIGSLKDERGGMLYLTYGGEHPEQIRLHIRDGKDVFRISTLELSGWYTMSEQARKAEISSYVRQLQAYVASLSNSGNLQTDIRNATEISTPSVLLSIPADRALAGLQGVTGTTVGQMADTMYQNILAWEDVLFTANQVQGIIEPDAERESYRYPMTTRQNIRYMRMFAGAFMYAAGNHVGVGYGSTSALVCGKPVSQTGTGKANGLFGWGIAHEIGHNMDKLGKAEVTNNIYSLAVQASDGGAMTLNTRLTGSNVWERIYKKVSAGRPGAANDVFVQLGMYWQLHLAYDEAEQPLAFYNAFFRQWKSGVYKEYSYDDRVALIASAVAKRDLTDFFTLTASAVAGTDLSEFFTRWGMRLSDEASKIIQTAGYPAEGRAVWYLNDAARTYRLENGAPNDGTTTVSAAADGSCVTLHMVNSDPDSILGYEILRDGTPIGFATESSYTDDLGVANNRTYTYAVIPVDRLGNQGKQVSCEEVRVAHEVIIPAGSYQMTPAVPDGNTLTIRIKEGKTPVTGIRISGKTALNGAFSVRLKADPAENAWTTVIKNSTLAGTSVVEYFHKPGADSTDTRLWTYDAAVLEITGIPAGASVELLGDPGDCVDFYEQATVGLLKNDYVYGEGEDDVVRAGTLVVLGTYRGDPLYNTVELEARYNTTAEAQEENEVTTITRAVNGYGLLFAEIPADGAVSDISDGFFLFVPDLEAEKKLNQADGVTDDEPLYIKVTLYRTDTPHGGADDTSRRITGETLWLSFPDAETLPLIELAGGGR